MASILLWFGVFLFIVLALPIIIWVIWWNISFVYPVWIARQVGKDPSDVIWFADKAKVRERRGSYEIIFKRQIDSNKRSPSIPGEFWTKFWKNTSAKFTEEEWARMDMSKHLKKGLFMYQSAEGEYKPLSIMAGEDSKVFRIISQDNRRWLADKTEETNEFALNKRQLLFMYGFIIVGMIILGIAFIMLLVYGTEYMQNICAQGPDVQNVLNSVQGFVGG